MVARSAEAAKICRRKSSHYFSEPYPEIGVAFSGGGIRSASFCSGVLRQLIKDGARIAKISSVSGGGYVGSSYMEWLAQGRRRVSAGTEAADFRSPMSDEEVAMRYFEHLKKNFAIYCDWHNNFPFKGLKDSIVFLCLALLSFVVLPLVMFLTCAVPSAIRVETFFGQLMRDAFTCPDGQPQTACIRNNWQSPVLWGSMVCMICGGVLLRISPSFETRCVIRYVIGMWLAAEMLLFGGLVFLPCLFELARRATAQSETPDLFDASGVMQAALILLYALLWVVIPQSPFHRRFGHVVVSLAAARLVQWRVFSMSTNLDSKSSSSFGMITVTVGVLVMFMPILGPLKFSLPFLYNRWRLQSLLHPDGSQQDWFASRLLQSKPESRTNPDTPITSQPTTRSQPLSDKSQEQVPWKVVQAPESKESSSSTGRQKKKANQGISVVDSASIFKRLKSVDKEPQASRYSLRKRKKGKLSEEPDDVDDIDGDIPGPSPPWIEDTYGEDEVDLGIYAGHVEISAGSMTLGDIGRVCPTTEFMSQVVANHWRYKHDSRYEDDCKLMILSTHRRPEALHAPVEGGLAGMQIKPDDICLADAMAMSGAAVSINNGMYSSSFASIRGLQIFLGLSIGYAVMNPMVTLGPNGPDNSRMLLQLLPVVCLQAVLGTCYLLLGLSIGGSVPCIIEFSLSAAIILLALVPVKNQSEDEDRIAEETDGVVAEMVKETVMSLKEKLLRIARWIVIHVHLAFVVREILDIHTTSKTAPPVFFMSDGGHIENLGLLPLLHRHCKKIVVCDAGLYPNEYEVVQDVIAAMRMARAWLNCSFTSMDGKDVLYDIQEKLIRPIGSPGGQPHCYKFRVTYHADPRDIERGIKSEDTHGEILLLQPRHPGYHRRSFRDQLNPFRGSLPGDDDFDTDRRWDGTVADDLTGCCCSCCHGHWRGLLHRLFGRFPFTSTFAQGFTPELFHAYQAEGERAANAQAAHEFWTSHRGCDCIKH